MNSTTLKGQLKQLTGKAKQEWAELTQDDWLRIEGDFDRLAGSIEERYGVAREAAEEQIRSFMTRIEAENKPKKRARPMPRRSISDVTARERAAAGL
ncbi:uncharacterized protein YjbJ (UPF0337 family) [Panacagrimonas perspica]|uniref:Uncharacterized protein YjbJ (UPF0337 family) n=1 Tax=Panacagrimonas perspica TaxID=381431 RepID=A0A4R7PBX1_9GAMM|nr:CsbD family protein [Panacagrimonas perspica]TDU31498.1 uncharacterized protein YjbJ (UPF0337 family) [Panacagrimonas perspica]THD03264.1 hypothetical protein B1810_11905 [Panacagrimonas perspica]